MVSAQPVEDADKISVLISGRKDFSPEALRQSLLQDLPSLLSTLVPGVTSAVITLQDEDAFGDDGLDALLEVTTSRPHVALDPLLEHLGTIADTVQGWRVHPTLIYDATQPVPLGAPSAQTSVVVFVQRLDGVTPEHFSQQWYVHAGHADGQEAESEQSLVERAREEASGLGARYVQNRVMEPLTPTNMLVHGYSQLHFPFTVPALPEEPYERTRGEEPFDRWPPRMLQGREIRVL